MSAIFGILRFDGQAVNPRDLERMSNTLAHRGPDGRKFVADGVIGLGHCLMRVNQEDLFEAQPLIDRAAGLTLVADCRIDNREELATSFGWSEAEARDRPDSAFILAAFKKWGEASPEHLLGDFAFAVWDAKAQQLFLARDHMGQRYFYYHKADRFFAFATEIKALWALAYVPRQISETQVGRHMIFQRVAGDGSTFFEGIHHIKGGSTLHVRSDAGVFVRRYWEPGAGQTHQGQNEGYYIQTYRRVLTEAVECRIRRLLRPPALLLSGGYDSGAIAGLSGPILGQQQRKLVTISSVLPEDAVGPDTSVRTWVEYCRRDMPHLDVRYFVRTTESLATRVDEVSRAAEAPPIAIHYVTEALFEMAAKAGSRLVMNGYGGDETLNPRLGNTIDDFLRQGRIWTFLSEFAAQYRHSGFSFRGMLGTVIYPFILTPLERVTAKFQGRSALWATRFIKPEFGEALYERAAININEMLGVPAAYAPPRARMLRALQDWAAKNRRNDSNEAAAHGLELTLPFRDKRVVELALALPPDLYIWKGQHRYLGKKALSDVYPAEFQTRPHRQDSLEPNFKEMVERAIPELRAAIEEMSPMAAVRNVIDLDALHAEVSALAGMAGTGRRFNERAFYFIRAFNTATFIATEQRDNLH